VEVVALLSQSRTAAAHCGLFTHKSVPVIFEPPCMFYDIQFNFYVSVSDVIHCVLYEEIPAQFM